MENLKKSALLTPELAAQAVEILRPSIETLIKNQNGRLVIYIVILDPVAAAKGVYEVLWEGPIGEANTDKWPKSYNEFAHAKTRVTFQTRLPSHLVRFHAPYMYQNGDFKFGGSDQAAWIGITIISFPPRSTPPCMPCASARSERSHPHCSSDNQPPNKNSNAQQFPAVPKGDGSFY
jgi:hypothetical protein